MYCRECGAEIEEDINFCPNCGYEVKRVDKNLSKREKRELPSERKNGGDLSTAKIIGITIALLVIVAIFLEGLGLFGQPIGKNAKPEGVAERYFKSLVRKDTETAYKLLSSNVQDETGYKDFKNKVETCIKSLNYEGLSLSFYKIKNVEKKENVVTLTVLYDLEDPRFTTTLDKSMRLVKENKSWRINHAYMPV